MCINYRVTDDPNSTLYKKYWLVSKTGKEYYLYIDNKKLLPKDNGLYQGYINDLTPKVPKEEGKELYYKVTTIEGSKLIKKEVNDITEELKAEFAFEETEEDPFE